MPTPPLPPEPRRPSYGVTEPTDGRGIRVCCWGLSPEQAKALCALARELGCRATDTSKHITESKSH